MASIAHTIRVGYLVTGKGQARVMRACTKPPLSVKEECKFIIEDDTSKAEKHEFRLKEAR